MNVEESAPVVRRGEKSGSPLVFAVVSAVITWYIVLYWDTASEIARVWWHSDTYAHGIIVLPVFAWLLWRMRERLVVMTPEPVAWMAVPVAVAGAAWALGKVASVDALTHFALVTMIVLTLVAALGWRVARAIAFPLLFLFFAVPIGDFLLPVMMDLTAEFTVGALRLSGVPVYQEGLFFVVPNGRWSVVEACSGIRYLIASLVIGALYAYLNYRSLHRRLLFMAVAFLVPIVANWLRAYMIVMLGYLSNNELAVGVDHLLYGWLFFGIVVLLMFSIGARWREDDSDVSADDGREERAAPSPKRWWVLAPVAIVSGVFPILVTFGAEAVQPFTVALDAPPAAAGWRFLDNQDPVDYRPDYTGYRGDVYQAYEHADGGVVVLYIAYYARQHPGAELIAWDNRLTGRGQRKWTVARTGSDEIHVGRVRNTLLTSRGESLDIWHWYWSNDRVIASDTMAKALLALDRLTGRSDEAAMVAVIAPFEDDSDAVRPLVEDFVEAHAADIRTTLENAGKTP